MEPLSSSAPFSPDASASSAVRRENSGELLLDRIAVYVLAVLTALLPIVFIPMLSAPFQFTKTAVAVGALLVAFILFIVARLKEGVLSIPYNLAFGALWSLPVVYVLSALFAASHLPTSFLGQRIESDTVFFMSAMALLATLVPLIVKRKQGVLTVYMGLFVSFSLLVLYQGLRLLAGADFLSFDIFTTTTSNIFGKWNDLGIFFGLTAILSLITLEGLKLKPLSQALLYVVLVFSLFFVALVNFQPIWITLGIFALGFFIYSFFKDKIRKQPTLESGAPSVIKNPRISILAIILLALSAIFGIWSTTIGNALPTYFEISHLEARPSWQSTAGVLKQTYAENAFLGSGPNTFADQWVRFKPQEINESLFWNVDFASGIGAIPTAFVTTGILGAVAWILFLGSILVLGMRALLFRPLGEGFSYYLTLSSFIGTVYLWVFSVIYVPNTALTVFTFLFTGLFFASLRHEGVLKEKRLAFAENPKLGFISVLVLTVLLISSLGGFYLVGERYASATSFQGAIVDLNLKGDLALAKEGAADAISTVELDMYHQFFAEMQILRLNEIVNSQEGTIDERRQMFQQELADGIEHAQRAKDLRPMYYQNWLTLGRVYASVVPLQIQGAYENAKEAYERARELAPHNPQVHLALAELEAVQQNNAAAKQYLDQALAEKSNYTAAVFLLAQIQIAEGDLENALKSVEAATLLAPQNPVVFFQLGLLRYNKQDFAGAAAALEGAVQINEVYANARYFLGLSYVKLGRTQDAIAQFARIEQLNPENQEVKTILANLRAGKEPFADVNAEAPEKRSEPPIEGE